MIATSRSFVIALWLVVCSAVAGYAQGGPEVETKFVAMLKNATLKGTWAPIREGQLGSEKKDESYRIARVEKKDGDKWAIISLVEFQGRQIEYPIPAVVRCAADTAVLILHNIQAGRGQENERGQECGGGTVDRAHGYRSF